MHAGRPCWQRNARSAGAGRLFGDLQRGSALLVTSSRNQGRIAAKLRCRGREDVSALDGPSSAAGAHCPIPGCAFCTFTLGHVGVDRIRAPV